MSKSAGGRLILVRHGESEGNRDRIFTTNPFELALTETGRRQAREAAAKIGAEFAPELVISSPYARARDTARIIAAELKLPLEIEPSLHEREMGDLKGEPYDAAFTSPAYNSTQRWLWKPPGGESLEEVRERTGPILDRLISEHQRQELVIVSHGGVMLSLWAHLTGSWEGAVVPPNCGIIVVEHIEGRYQPPRIIDQK